MSNTTANAKGFEELVQKVLYAVAAAMTAQRADQYLLTVFTGGTAGLKQALAGLETLMLNGMTLRVLMSESSDHLYGDVVKNKIMCWPNACAMESGDWFSQVQKCTGVVVPMLSVASLSRVVSLAPDTLATNIILQALFMGKPVVTAIDGAAPGSADRAVLGLDKGTPALSAALARRLVELSDYGAGLTLSQDLGDVVLKVIDGKEAQTGEKAGPAAALAKSAAMKQDKPVVFAAQGTGAVLRVVDAGHVRMAKNTGGVITAAPGAIVTPLAFELAKEWGVQIR